eukprot:TRINITY_DN811_c0_g2_i1.p1 TRINITY_DN811_c0_g2~~TRINITY_DN811_c0_g2_i1.p1  ORF type:complete len:172 (-),score=48.78 TRINITY_DN811_c0_g2_i1:7-522(-)
MSTQVYASHPNLNWKNCGHYCACLYTKRCCPCGDQRPAHQRRTKYVDGVGMTSTAQPHEYYCMTCRDRINGVDVTKANANANANPNAKPNANTNTNTTNTPKLNTVTIPPRDEWFCPHSPYYTDCRLCPRPTPPTTTFTTSTTSTTSTSSSMLGFFGQPHQRLCLCTRTLR